MHFYGTIGQHINHVDKIEVHFDKDMNMQMMKAENVTQEEKGDGEKSIGSPICLSSQRGVKIDFIRVMNAWYECGKVEKVGGGHLTKKEYFTWLGKLFNIDLSNYCKDLSNSMSAAVSYEKQTHIFEELKKKENEIYNKK